MPPGFSALAALASCATLSVVLQLLPMSVQAQTVAWGVQLGAGASRALNGQPPVVQPRAAWVVDLHPESMYGLRSGLRWSRQAFDHYAYEPGTYGPSYVREELDGLGVPFLLRVSAPFDQNGRPSLLGGFEFTRRIRGRVRNYAGMPVDESVYTPEPWMTAITFAFSIEGHVGSSTIGGELSHSSVLGIGSRVDDDERLSSWSAALTWWPRWRGTRPIRAAAGHADSVRMRNFRGL